MAMNKIIDSQLPIMNQYNLRLNKMKPITTRNMQRKDLPVHNPERKWNILVGRTINKGI